MSYRAFKRLIGETSLERKCRFLFGAFILLLITASFWFYARQTESLAYEQMSTMSRLMVYPIVVRQHVKNDASKRAGDEKSRELISALDELRDKLEDENRPPLLNNYVSKFIKPGETGIEITPNDTRLLKEFQADESKNEDNRLNTSQKENYYTR